MLLAASLRAQYTQQLYETVDLSEVDVVELDLFGEVDVASWAGHELLITTRVEMMGGSESLLKYLVDSTQRYRFRTDSLRDTGLLLQSLDDERRPLQLRGSVIDERVSYKIMLPAAFALRLTLPMPDSSPQQVRLDSQIVAEAASAPAAVLRYRQTFERELRISELRQRPFGSTAGLISASPQNKPASEQVSPDEDASLALGNAETTGRQATEAAVQQDLPPASDAEAVKPHGTLPTVPAEADHRSEEQRLREAHFKQRRAREDGASGEQQDKRALPDGGR